MKVCIFCHDSYMSGANLALKDWIDDNKQDQFILVIPHKNVQFKNEFKNKNIKVVVGNYFCLVKNLTKMPLMYCIKKSLKKIYMVTIGKLFLQRLYSKLNQINPDVVISNSFVLIYGALYSQKNHKKHVWYIREFMEEDHMITHYNKKQIKKLAEESYALYISEVIESKYQKIYHFRKCVTIYDKIAFEKKYKRIIPKFQNEPLHAIMAGSLSLGKGQWDAIFAVEKLTRKGYKIMLDIYGDGPIKKDIENYLRERKLDNISLKCFSTDLNKLRSRYDLAFVCSKNEALGRVTVEAMYYGNLVLGANSGFTKYIVQDKQTGILYKSGNVDDLVLKLENVYQNATENNKIIRNAQKYALNNFSKSISLKIELYLKLVIGDEV